MAEVALSSTKKKFDHADDDSSDGFADQVRSKNLGTKLRSTEVQPEPVLEQGCTGLRAIHAQAHP
eukprot:2759652-Pleurochrysis_carterae.AAC.1